MLVVAHPEDRERYENNWEGARLVFITTNPKILTQCVRALDGGNEWIYVQRMAYQRWPSRIIGRLKVARFNEDELRVWFEDWEGYDADPLPLPYGGGSTFGDFPE